MTANTKRLRNQRLEVRTSKEDRALIDRAVAATDTDLTSFVTSNLTIAAHRVLADRTEFTLDPESQQQWDQINRRQVRNIEGLRNLMARPSPFTDA